MTVPNAAPDPIAEALAASRSVLASIDPDEIERDAGGRFASKGGGSDSGDGSGLVDTNTGGSADLPSAAAAAADPNVAAAVADAVVKDHDGDAGATQVSASDGTPVDVTVDTKYESGGTVQHTLYVGDTEVDWSREGSGTGDDYDPSAGVHDLVASNADKIAEQADREAAKSRSASPVEAAFASARSHIASIDPDEIERDDGGRFASKGGGGDGGGDSGGPEGGGGAGAGPAEEVTTGDGAGQADIATDDAALEAGLGDALLSNLNDGNVDAFEDGELAAEQGGASLEGTVSLSDSQGGGAPVDVGFTLAPNPAGVGGPASATLDVGGVQIAGGNTPERSSAKDTLDGFVKTNSDVIRDALTAARETTPAEISRPGGEGSLTPVTATLPQSGADLSFSYDPQAGWTNPDAASAGFSAFDSLSDIASNLNDIDVSINAPNL